MATFFPNGKGTQVKIRRKLGNEIIKFNKNFSDETEAKKWARYIESLIDQGIDPRKLAEEEARQQEAELQKKAEERKTREAQEFTVADAVNHWRTTRPDEAKEYNSRLVAFEEDLGDVKIFNLDADGLDLYFKRKEKEPIKERRKNPDPRIPNRTFSTTTLRKYAYYLKKILRAHASANKYKFDSSIFEFKKPPNAEHRERRLFDGELERLMEACNRNYVNKDELKYAILFAIYSTMRTKEQMQLKWSDVYLDFKDPHKSYIRTRRKDTKNRNRQGVDRERRAPMTQRLFKLITEDLLPLKSQNDERLFHMWRNPGAFRNRFKVVKKNAGVDWVRNENTGKMEYNPLHWHDFRHEGISQIYELYGSTLTDLEIAKIAYLKNLQTLTIYANLRHSTTALKLWEIDENRTKEQVQDLNLLVIKIIGPAKAKRYFELDTKYEDWDITAEEEAELEALQTEVKAAINKRRSKKDELLADLQAD
ncbi:MAG TPA: tyrosine-type recombinase/integrase [Anaerovoracaceae bacterium]|nr:tyrosine-type recombinase/integrase [Anaerovoracaceae bacterium]